MEQFRNASSNRHSDMFLGVATGKGLHSYLLARTVKDRNPAWTHPLLAGLAKRQGIRLVSRGTSVRIRFGCPFSSKVVVCGHCLVTLSLTK